ncbi:DnaJ domain-containing protein [Paraphoma chrysanthemicola]|uniref:DnaJ domain-containing protein n=1 Tax=Paraphoma chrysanthemicola TaxID=798071 RepID=A0A8K0R3C1_9PLEO|nr:DnaJ domain-containing protein [Paraphoma chrysanthemicola]
MAPSAITDDYYAILEFDQTATTELITKSYRRLALKLHPDRNTKINATETFQLLLRAYNTLKIAGDRQAYDRIYPSLKRKDSATSSYAPRPPPATNHETDAQREAKEIAALEKSKEERTARWRTKNAVFESSISELQKSVRQIQQEIKNLDSIRAAEAAAEANKNSWTTWLLSPLYKKPEESEEEKARKDREKQERRIQRDMKERRLAAKKTELQLQETQLRKAKDDADAAIQCDESKIQSIKSRIHARHWRARQEKERERLEKERLERERLAAIRKRQQDEQDRKDREAAEIARKKQAEIQAAYQKKQAEILAAHHKRVDEERTRRAKMAQEQAQRTREQTTQNPYTASFGFDSEYTMATCAHDGWWDKIQGRAACPECADVWTYLLECPSCPKQACPKCQAMIRPRWNRGAARRNQRRRSPSPEFAYYERDYDW